MDIDAVFPHFLCGHRWSKGRTVNIGPKWRLPRRPSNWESSWHVKISDCSIRFTCAVRGRWATTFSTAALNEWPNWTTRPRSSSCGPLSNSKEGNDPLPMLPVSLWHHLSFHIGFRSGCSHYYPNCELRHPSDTYWMDCQPTSVEYWTNLSVYAHQRRIWSCESGKRCRFDRLLAAHIHLLRSCKCNEILFRLSRLLTALSSRCRWGPLGTKLLPVAAIAFLPKLPLRLLISFLSPKTCQQGPKYQIPQKPTATLFPVNKINVC